MLVAWKTTTTEKKNKEKKHNALVGVFMPRKLASTTKLGASLPAYPWKTGWKHGHQQFRRTGGHGQTVKY